MESVVEHPSSSVVERPTTSFAATAQAFVAHPVVRVTCTALVALLLLGSGDVRAGIRAVPHAHTAWLIAGVVLAAATVGVSGLRWQRLLGLQGIRLSALSALRHTFVGQLYATALAGPATGDAVRIARVSSGGRFPQALSATAVDRALGTVGLVAVGFGAAVLSGEAPGSITLALALLCAAGTVAILLLFLRRGRVHQHVKDWSVGGGLAARCARGVANAVRPFRGAYGVFVEAMTLSMLVQVIGIGMALALAASVGIELDTLTMGWIFSVVLVVQSVPITIAGIGTRDGALVYLLGQQGVSTSSAITLSVLLLGANISVAILGLVVEVLTPRSKVEAPARGVEH